MTTKTESFGQRLQRLRKARGLRVLDVAYAAGIIEGAIWQMESGTTKGASLVVGLRLREDAGRDPRVPGDRRRGAARTTRACCA